MEVQTTLTCKHLKTSDKFIIAGIRMEFAYWHGHSPAFTHSNGGHDITYVNKNWKENTPLTDLK